MTFPSLKTQISLLNRAEYRYDLLVSNFAEHYLELTRANYEPRPDIAVFTNWLRHLHCDIRPSLLNAWEGMASHFGFALGDKITLGPITLYAIRLSCYPLEEIVRIEGIAAKKDGKPSQSMLTLAVSEHSQIQRHEQKVGKNVLEPLLFPGTTRLANVRKFIEDATAGLSK
ncbi:MAG: hypothetical protein AAB263_17165 [Planctomycetota bacterium]